MKSSTVFDPEVFRSMPLIAILRNQPLSVIPHLVQAVTEGGFCALEITMNSPGATDQIRAAIGVASEKTMIGAGTVTTLAELDDAQQAGAGFIVTPVVVPEVITECVRRKLPVFPGAFTPTEVHTAHQLGATMVKLFPAHRLGPDYLRDIKAPLSAVPILATGGITPENLPLYAQAGAEGFGIGSPLLSAEAIARGDWGWIKHRAAEFCRAWSEAVNGKR
jgi:2-dehydro-3-deoxyphosphogluconate aldolase / (4S)-4-hydroxy-2-oxoglutarate aldolase